MYVDCADCPLRQSSAFRPLAGDELEFVRGIKEAQFERPARTTIFEAGDSAPRLYTLFSGWAFRYLLLGGGARQILDILLPGDLIGLQSPMTGAMRHSVATITEVSLCQLDGAEFRCLFERHPQLSEALVATLLYEENRADRRLLLLGRQRPTQRLAYLLLELHERLAHRGMANGKGFRLPLTYEHLADLVGVSRSQIGASLNELRERGWATLRDGQLELHDREAMARGCSYAQLPDPSIRALI
jgi:CRP/FNR family transcriptional regulator